MANSVDLGRQTPSGGSCVVLSLCGFVAVRCEIFLCLVLFNVLLIASFRNRRLITLCLVDLFRMYYMSCLFSFPVSVVSSVHFTFYDCGIPGNLVY